MPAVWEDEGGEEVKGKKIDVELFVMSKCPGGFVWETELGRGFDLLFWGVFADAVKCEEVVGNVCT